MKAVQEPPYLAGASGVLNFLTNHGVPQSCDLSVYVVDKPTNHFFPQVSSDIQPITISYVSSQPADSPPDGWSHRVLRYRVCLESIPSGTQVGNVRISNPGMPGPPLLVPVLITDNSNLRLLNPILTLNIGVATTVEPQVKLIVKSNTAKLQFRFKDHSIEQFLIVNAPNSNTDASLYTFVLRAIPGKVIPLGVYEFEVWSENAGKAAGQLTIARHD
jgi:hypothetical protein